jgi:membrane-bound lytic murein transglycosylase D
MRRMFGLPASAVLLMCGTAACSSNPRPQLAAAPQLPVAQPLEQPEVVAPPVPVPAPDPVLALMAESDRLYELGTRELALGHLAQARAAFDRSLDALLQAPGGARAEPRLRLHFDRLVDRIAAHDALALQAGDAFTETPSEPAAIDELLEIATFSRDTLRPRGLDATVEADLAATLHDIPIPLNDRVLGYVELFQGRLRDFLAGGLERGSRYLPMIQNVFRAEGIPLDLAYVPLIESAFKPTALSRAKARGMWQFMSGTARDMGLKEDWYIDERADPEKATIGAAKYLKVLYGMFSDWHLALASYNGGPGRVQRAMKTAGVDDFWALSSSSSYLPHETREYVPMILAAIIIARNPAQYGFEIAATTPLAYDKVAVPRAVDLRRVAEWTATSIDEIRSLNPELRRQTTPLRYPGYELKVPAGLGPELEARLQRAHVELTALRWHTVRRGETLTTIARTLGVSATDLAQANDMSLRSVLQTGRRLVVPRAPGAPLLAAAGPAARTPAAAATRAAARSDARGVAGDAAGQMRYRVKQGDTLSRIAALHGVTIADLKTWNRMRSDRLSVGDQLTILRHETDRTRAAQ